MWPHASFDRVTISFVLSWLPRKKKKSEIHPQLRRSDRFVGGKIDPAAFATSAAPPMAAYQCITLYQGKTDKSYQPPVADGRYFMLLSSGKIKNGKRMEAHGALIGKKRIQEQMHHSDQHQRMVRKKKTSPASPDFSPILPHWPMKFQYGTPQAMQ